MPDNDTSHRIHIAANDPAFPAKREAAVTLICAGINAIATPLGYTCKGTTWSRSTPLGRSVIHLHRNQYGWFAEVYLRFLLPDGSPATGGLWGDGDDLRLQDFFPAAKQPSHLAYLDINEGSATLDTAMHVLRTLALPWLDAHHAGSPQQPTS